MNKRQKDWLVLFGAITIITGFVMTMNHGCAGWLLILLGMTYLSGLTTAGRGWISENPDYFQWGLIGGAVVLVILVIGVVL